MEARQAIGDSGQRQCRIKTVRSRGYRFVASVEERPAAGPATAPRPSQGLAMVRGCADCYSSTVWRSAAATPAPRLASHGALGAILFFRGEYAAARSHLEQGIALIDPMVQWPQALRHGEAPGVWCLTVAALTLWCLGYPEQALRHSQEGLAQAQALADPYSGFAQKIGS